MAQFVQQNSQGPHVDLVIVRLVVDHFGRHVLERATKSVALFIGVLLNAPPEITYLDCLVLRDQKVLRLQVSVYKPIVVKKVDTGHRLYKVVKRHVFVYVGLLISNDVKEVALLDVLQDQVDIV